METTTIRTWSSLDACELLGISYRCLNYWASTTPILQHQASVGSGARRRWTEEELQRLDLLNRLRLAGLSLIQAREFAGGTDIGEPISVHVGPGVYLLAEWRSIESIERDGPPSG